MLRQAVRHLEEHPMSKRLLQLLALLLTIGLFAAACGDDGDDNALGLVGSGADRLH